ncbi:MAG: FCD domain-containing protein [Streptosporangiales bacterium]|nr:FCD domain-containing protein [Streptosporangiales bacterium]
MSVMQYSSKSDIVCAMLRELIISGELAPSEPLRQRDLAARFGVSQTPVREALRRLESEGLVVGDAHRGAIVSASRSGMAEENAQIRAALEPLGARLAAREITEEQLGVLRQLNEEMTKLPEGDGRYATLNREFHFTIYESAASPMLLSMMRLLWQAMPDGPQVTRSHRESAKQHAELIEALAARDGDRAAAITEKHILSAGYVEQERPAKQAPSRTKAKRAKKSAAARKS